MGDSPDGEDATDDDPADDAPAEDAPADDGTDGPPADEDTRLMETRQDFDSYISETRMTRESPGGESLTIEMYTEWDRANDRVYRSVEQSMEDSGDLPAFEYYMIEATTYQIRPDGCVSFDSRTIERDEVAAANLRMPEVWRTETDDDVEQLEPAEVNGEPVEIWRFDLGEDFALEGEMTIYISRDTSYVVMVEGWYETGHGENPTTVRFEQRNHGFDEPLDIEPPEECER